MTRISTAVDVSGFTTDAKFRTWGSTISASLAASGLVKTADTGQVDWTTVLKPTVSQTYTAYEVWRFNDDLQATAPIFIRLEYGVGNPTTDPNTRVQVGTGTDGAGNLTGHKTNRGDGGGNNVGSASTVTNMVMTFTHTDGYAFAFASGSVLTFERFATCLFIIDRTRDQDTGAPNGDGMHVIFMNGQAQMRSQTVSFLGGAQIETWVSTMPPGDATNYGGALFPVYACTPRPLVCVGALGYMNAEIAAYSTFTATPIGATMRTYLAMGVLPSSSLYGSDSPTGVSNAAAVRLAVLWED